MRPLLAALILLAGCTPAVPRKRDNLAIQVTVRVQNRETGRAYVKKSDVMHASGGDARLPGLIRLIEEMIEANPPTAIEQSIERGEIPTIKKGD